MTIFSKRRWKSCVWFDDLICVTLFFQEYEIKVLGEKVNGMDLELELKADACVVLEGKLRTAEEEMQKECEVLKSELEA